MKVLPPKNETIWVQIVQSDVVTHIITSDPLRSMYYLYTVDQDGILSKTRYKNADPTELERKIK